MFTNILALCFAATGLTITFMDNGGGMGLALTGLSGLLIAIGELGDKISKK